MNESPQEALFPNMGSAKDKHGVQVKSKLLIREECRFPIFAINNLIFLYRAATVALCQLFS